jgi:putative tryptophan/tyrosine transport system substrate-binding protein
VEAVPGITRVALLLSAGDPFNADRIQPVATAARAVGVHLHLVEAEVPQGLEAAFSTMTRQGVGAPLVSFTPILSTYRAQIAELVVKHRLPSIAEPRTFAEQGGLMSYGRNPADGWRRQASYLNRILKGAKPGDLPIEQPTTFELVINLKTAQALGKHGQDLLYRGGELSRLASGFPYSTFSQVSTTLALFSAVAVIVFPSKTSTRVLKGSLN